MIHILSPWNLRPGDMLMAGNGTELGVVSDYPYRYGLSWFVPVSDTLEVEYPDGAPSPLVRDPISITGSAVVD